MNKCVQNGKKKMIILNSKTGKLIPMGNLKALLFNTSQNIDTIEPYFLSADNNIYALVQFEKPYIVNKSHIEHNLPYFKLTQKDFEKLNSDEYTVYPFEVIEYYKSKYVVYDREKYKGNNIIVEDYELPFENNSQTKYNEYFKDSVKFVVNNENIEETVDLISILFNEQIKEYSNIEFSLSLVPKDKSIVNLLDFPNELNPSKYDMMFTYPRGIISRLVKNGNIVKLYSKDLGDISDKFPKIIKEALHIPYNKFLCDCFLCLNNTSEFTFKKMIEFGENIDEAYLVLFDSDYSDEDLSKMTPNKRYQYLKPCALGTNKFKIVSIGPANDLNLVQDLYNSSNTGIIILSGDYKDNTKYIKSKGKECELIANKVLYTNNRYLVDTDFGRLSTKIPCLDGKKIVVCVGESIFELIDSGYDETNRV